jgi:hypothetical protein
MKIDCSTAWIDSFVGGGGDFSLYHGMSSEWLQFTVNYVKKSIIPEVDL